MNMKTMKATTTVSGDDSKEVSPVTPHKSSFPKEQNALSTQQKVTSLTFDLNNLPNTYTNSNGINRSQTQDQKQPLDFIGSSGAVNDLFSLSYKQDVDIAVAVHNVGGGILLLDGGDLHKFHGNTKADTDFCVSGWGDKGNTNTSTTDRDCSEKDKLESHKHESFKNISRRRRRGRNYIGSPSTTKTEKGHQSNSLMMSSHEDASINSQVMIVRRNPQNEQNAPSYAEIVRKTSMVSKCDNENKSMALQIIPDFKQSCHYHRLLSAPLTALMPPSSIESHAYDIGLSITSKNHNINQNYGSSCVILDSYLDRIVSNVPQLGGYFRGQNIMHGINALLQTENIPLLCSSSLKGDIYKSTSESTDIYTNITDKHKESLNKDIQSTPEHDISPELIESNAAMLLQFLKTNCFRENSTYLLHRAAGETNIQLYDITSLSSQRHRKWMWWLAMMSYRFALRLKQLLEETLDTASPSERRNFRERTRGLMETSLELLHEIADMDGSTHETICAAICEHIADSYLYGHNEEKENQSLNGSKSTDGSSSASFFNPVSFTKHQLYNNVNVDRLSKAQDNLIKGILELQPTLSKGLPYMSHTIETEITNQMYKLHQKLVQVTLRLAEHHLQNYWSSSAMQALRLSARKFADSVKLLEKAGVFNDESETRNEIQLSLFHQIGVIRFDCANFARSFAADEMWRERGAACGEDVIGLLRDVELSIGFVSQFLMNLTQKVPDKSSTYTPIGAPTISMRSCGLVGDLHYLSGIVPLIEGKQISDRFDSCPNIERANWILEKQKILIREKRRALIASSICYSHASDIFSSIISTQSDERSSKHASAYIQSISVLIKKRLGDSCNEIGSIMLNELKKLIQTGSSSSAHTPLLLSAKFWYEEAITNFKACKDKKNVALLLCNLSQCCKIHANISNKTEKLLDQSSKHLELAHDILEQRDSINKNIWDRVSFELANVFLVLAVTRRKTILREYESHEKSRISHMASGKESSVVSPFNRALEIFMTLGEAHQFAATNYQLALFYAKTWSLHRDEEKTRDRLSLAVKHFATANQYFSTHMDSNESTFVLLSLDTATLFNEISGFEKALACCIHTAESFSPKAIDASKLRGESSWFSNMKHLALQIEDMILKLLLTLIKRFPDKNAYKMMYRTALAMKRDNQTRNCEEEKNDAFAIYDLLVTLKNILEDSEPSNNGSRSTVLNL